MMVELLDQLRQGSNFEDAAPALDPITAETASAIVPGSPYTILQNLAHTNVWQRYLLGGPEAKLPSQEEEWPSPAAEEWDAVRRSFLEGWERAREVAVNGPDSATTTRLLHVALHGAYHLGQIALLRQIIEREVP